MVWLIHMGTIRTMVTEGGRVVIPAEFRKQYGIEVEKTINLTAEEDDLLITTADMTLRRLQRRFKAAVPEGVSLVDELIAERREGATNE